MTEPTFTTFEEAVETLGTDTVLELVNWALNYKDIQRRASARYRIKQQMVVRRMEQLAKARGIDLEELLASDHLQALEEN